MKYAHSHQRVSASLGLGLLLANEPLGHLGDDPVRHLVDHQVKLVFDKLFRRILYQIL